MSLDVSDLQAGKRKFGIHHLKACSKTCFVSLILATQCFNRKLSRLDKACEPPLCMFHFTPALFDQELQIVNRFFFEASQRTVHRLCRAHLGTGIATLEDIPLHLGANRPFRFKNRQVLGVKFLVAKQSNRREIIGTGSSNRVLVTLAFNAELTEARMLFDRKRLEFIHRADTFRRFHRRCCGEACVRVQQACKSHTGKRLVAEGIFVSVFGFGKGHFGTETFRLANLTALFELLGTVQMFFKVLFSRLAHADKLFAQAERKVLGRDIHQNGVLRHFKFCLTGVHILLGGVISRINLETGKNRPNDGQASVKEPIVLHLHVEIGVVDVLSRGRAILFRSLLSECFWRTRAKLFLEGIFGISLCLGFAPRLGIGAFVSLLITIGSFVVGLDICLGISGSTGYIAKRLLDTPEVNINGVIDFGNASRQTHRREETGKSFIFATLGNIHFRLFSLDFGIVRHGHIQRILQRKRCRISSHATTENKSKVPFHSYNNNTKR